MDDRQEAAAASSGEQKDGVIPPGGAGPEPEKGERVLAKSLLQRGLDHYDREELKHAASCYRQAIASDPSFALAYNNLGMVLIDLEQYDEAVETLHRALSIDPASSETYNNLGFVLRRQGRDLEAASAYAKFLELEPEVEEAPRIRQWIQGVCAQLGLETPPPFALSGIVPDAAAMSSAPPEEQVPAAAEQPLPAIPPRQVPAEPEASPETATRTAEEQGVPAAVAPSPVESPLPAPSPAASPQAEAKTAEEPELPKIRKTAVWQLAKEETAPSAPVEQPVAAAPPAQVSEVPAQTEIILDEGWTALEKDDLEYAASVFEAALQRQPDCFPALLGLGKVRVRQERFEEGVELLQKAAATDPAAPAPYFDLGFALRTLNRELEAAEAYENFLRLLPQALDAESIRQWATYIKEREKGKAAPEKALEESAASSQAETPATPEAASTDKTYRRILELFHNGDFYEAELAAVEVLQGDPAYFPARVLLGRIYLRRDDYARAAEQFEGALVTAPEDAEALYFLGQTLDKQGRTADARDVYRRCLTAAPAGPRAERLRKLFGEADAAAKSAEETRVQCEFCLRRFAPETMSEHDGKQACPNCLSLLSEKPAAEEEKPREEEQTAAPAPHPETVKRPSPAPQKSKRGLLWIGIPVLAAATFGALAMTGHLLPLLTAIRLLPPPKKKKPASRPDTPTKPVRPATGNLEQVRLKIEMPEKAVLPLKPWRAQAGLKGPAGPPAQWEWRFKLRGAPEGMVINPKTGEIRWTPPVGKSVPSATDGVIEFELFAEGRAPKAGAPVKTKGPLRLRLYTRFGYAPIARPRSLGLEAGVALDCAVGDFNHDGRDDLVLAEGLWRNGSLQVFLQREEDPLPSPLILRRGLGCFSAAVSADLDGNGRDDIVAVCRQSSRLEIFRQLEGRGLVGEKPRPVERGPSAVAAADVDGDGRVEIAVFSGLRRTFEVCTRLPGTAFELSPFQRVATKSGGPGAVIIPWHSPFRGSGWLLIVPTAELPLQFVGWREGRLQSPVSFAIPGSGVVVAAAAVVVEAPAAAAALVEPPASSDKTNPQSSKTKAQENKMEKEGKEKKGKKRKSARRLVLLWGTPNTELRFYKETRQGFRQVTSETPILLPDAPRAMCRTDLNGDGFDDLAVVSKSGLRLFMRSETGYVPGPGPFPGRFSGPVVALEFNGDGRPDLLLFTEERQVRLFRSLAPNVK